MAGATIDLPGLGETKRTYVYVGLAGVAGVVGYAYWARRQAAAAAPPADGTTYSEDYASLSGGGAAGTTTTGLGAGDSGGSTTVTDPDLLPPTTNIEWSQRVTTILTERFGFDGQMVGSTLGKYLARIGLNTAEQDLIRTAWGQLGRPPVGDFPIIAASATQNPPPDTTTPPPAQMTPAYDLAVSKGQQVDSFVAQIRARSGKDIDWPLLEATNPGLAANINWGPSGSKDTSIRVFRNNGTYHIPSVPK